MSDTDDRIIGHTRSGRAVFAIAGGDGTDGAEGADGGEEKPADDKTDYKAEAEKWKAMSRKHEGQAKANADAAKRLKELEDADKTETQRLLDASTAAEKRAEAAEAKALKYEVAAEKSVPGKLVRFLNGSTREELESAADELLEAVGTPGTGEGGETTGGKPKEKLRGGASNDDDAEEKSLADVMAAIPRP